MPIKEIEEFFGTEVLGKTVNSRLTKCYEIAGAALSVGAAPKRAKLVHGSMHHIRVEHRINYAWLILPSRMIWEPIAGSLWVPAAWNKIVRPEIHKEYDRDELRKMMNIHKHWGPWMSQDN